MLNPPDPLEHERLHTRAQASSVDSAIAKLRKHGERVTAPRRLVLQALAGRADHLTADEVWALLEDADVHRATVYRTLDLLSATGVVTHHHAAGGATRYHLSVTAAGAEHLHGHCLGCGVAVVLPADALESTGRRLEEDTGFRLDGPLSTLAGMCAACAP